MAQARADERDANQIRPMKCELECVAKSDGSCQFSCGETVVIAAIYGFRDVSVRNEQVDRATVQVQFRDVGGSLCVNDAVPQRLIEACISSAGRLNDRPRSALTAAIHVVRDDGGVLGCAMNAVSMALMDAAIPLNYSFSAMTCIYKDDVLMLDPTAAEIAMASATITSAVEHSTDKEGAHLSLHHEGGITVEQLSYALDSLIAGTAAVDAFMRASLQKRLKRAIKV